MNKEMFALIADEDVPEEFHVKLITMAVKMQRAKTIGDCKVALLAFVDLLTEVEDWAAKEKAAH